MAHIKPQNRLRILGVLFAIAFFAISGRLAVVQILEHDYWESMMHQGRQITVRTPAIRGYIRDRNNIILADNRPSYDVDLYLPEIVAAHENRIKEYNQNHPDADPREKLMIRERRKIEGEWQMADVPDIVEIVRREVLPALEEQGLVYQVDEERLRSHFRKQLLVPYTLGEDLHFHDVAKFLETSLEIPGVEVTTRPVRRYLYGAMLSHVLGYVGSPIDVNEMADAQSFNFYQPDQIGKAGIEMFRNAQLLGEPGTIVRLTDPKGGLREEVHRTDATQGADIYLTIDSRIQSIAEDAMRAIGRGSCVIVDPRNGDVLAMVSIPSYDPNTFLGITPQAWQAITSDPAKPLSNRAISGYAPGSTYKVPISLCGMTSDTGNQGISCAGRWWFGNRAWKCWRSGGHGYLTMADALKVSCNCYYYEYANRVGIDEILRVGKLLGLGQRTGIDVQGESPGILPGPWFVAMLNEKREPGTGRIIWNKGSTANVAIGQGAVEVTPLQMAMVSATVANGGKVFVPRIIREVVPQGENPHFNTPGWPGPEPVLRSNLLEHGLTKEKLDIIRLGMWKVVNESGGTARRARHPDIEVAGKTGTVQVPFRDDKNDAWFISFAPYDDPKLAMAIQVEGAKAGGLVGAPIAGKIITEIMKLEKSPFYDLKPLDPAQGSFDFIELIDFDLPNVAVRSAPTENLSDETSSLAAPGQSPEPPGPEQISAPAEAGGESLNFANPTPGDSSFDDANDDDRRAFPRFRGGRRR